MDTYYGLDRDVEREKDTKKKRKKESQSVKKRQRGKTESEKGLFLEHHRVTGWREVIM